MSNRPGAHEFLIAARVPKTLLPQSFGLWTIERRKVDGYEDPTSYFAGWQDYTLLRRISDRSIHLEGPGEVVMEDSKVELSRHLPVWLRARGRVLVTGLGLGCVVRGLLASPAIEHVDVVEIDRDIVRVVGREFAGNQRVTLHHGDALEIIFPLEARWDFAWHDLWTDGDIHLQQMHAHLMLRFRDRVRNQGAWAFPRQFARLYSRHLGPILGAPRLREIA